MRDRFEHRTRIRADHGKPRDTGKPGEHGKPPDHRKHRNHGEPHDHGHESHQIARHPESVVADDTGCQLFTDLVGRLVGLISLITVDWRVIDRQPTSSHDDAIVHEPDTSQRVVGCDSTA